MTLVLEKPVGGGESVPFRLSPPTRPDIDIRPQRVHLSESSRALLGLLKLSETAARELGDTTRDMTFAGVISKSVLRLLLGTLHHRHSATVRHSRRVALLAFGLANHLGWDGRQLRVLEVAGLLHDIGKIGVPDTVLEKPGRLSSEELELIALHNNVGFNVLQACRVDRQIQEIISQSQHAYTPDLDAVPDLRAGNEVDMGARILAVADAYDSLGTDQPHRRSKSHQEIMAVLTEGAGRQFDANVVSALSRWVQQDGLPFANYDAAEEGNSSNPSPIELHEADAISQVFSYLHTLERLYDGFHLLDMNGEIVVWNRRSAQLFGRSAEEMLGRKWSMGLLGYRHLDDRPMPPQESPMLRAVESGRTALRDMRATNAAGQAVQLELQAAPLFDEQGRLHGVAEFYRDLERSSSKPSHDFHDLKLAATRDALTNVANRRELENQLEAMVAAFTEKPDEPFSVIFVDADHFKSVNDTYGHGVGDQVLSDLAQLLTQETYSGEVVGRFGGEEFMILCPGTDLEQTVRRAERLRNVLRSSQIGGVQRLKITASFGVAQAEPGDTAESVVRRADKALYKAKEEGRDRTCSLTNADFLTGGRLESASPEMVEPFLFRSNFTAVVASEMVVHKLGAFVHDHKATLSSVSAERVVMQIGRKGFFASLNLFPQEIPVQIELAMNGLANARAGNGTPRIQVGVTIRPLGVQRDSAAFEGRTRQLSTELKRYFAAD